LQFQFHLAMSAIVKELKATVLANAKPLQDRVAKLKTDTTVIQEITVEQAIGGMRGINGMLTQTSDLDPMDGIKYRGLPLAEAMRILPCADEGESALPEGTLWMLLTGDVPTKEQCKAVTAELHARSEIPASVLATIDSLPVSMHAMTQLSIALLSLQPDSKFAAAYTAGIKKGDYWEYALEDSLTLMAQIPVVAAKIYRRKYKDGKTIPSDKNMDWAGNYANMLGVSNDPKFRDAIRLYLSLHADHEGGNVSAHTAHTVGSALSDPFLAWAAGNNGLAGPLHGLANQECLLWLNETMQTLGNQEPTVEVVTEFAKKTLASGKVIPGFGHAVLRNTDPRYALEHEFAMKNLPNDPTFKLANACFQAIPPVLKASGKAKNPYPNVDALSGTILKYYDLTQADYYTVVFSCSRCIGVMAQLVMSRLFNIPIERPNSVTIEFLEGKVAAAPKSKL